MNARIPLLTFCVLNAAAAARAGDLHDSLAHESSKSAPEIGAPEKVSRWRAGAAYAPVIGLEAKFGGLGRFESPFTPQPLGGGIDYDYDNGFVHVDSSDNAGDQTWNWGYENDSQYDPTVAVRSISRSPIALRMGEWERTAKRRPALRPSSIMTWARCHSAPFAN